MKVMAEPYRRNTGNIWTVADRSLQESMLECRPDGGLCIRFPERAPGGQGGEYMKTYEFSREEAWLIADVVTR
jgi:hypothetical protein